MKIKAQPAMTIFDEILGNKALTSSINLDHSTDDSLSFIESNQRLLALTDIKNGLIKWPIWLMLAYQDIKLRYRRSILGPFWLTLSMAITVYAMGYIYSNIFRTDMAEYLPYLTAGMLGWTLISTMIIELSEGLVASESLIKQVKLPYTLHLHRIACRNMLIFFHHLVIFIPIILIYHHSTNINLYTLLIVPGLLLIYINAINYGLILSIIGARYRDISQIIKSLVQVVFFVTPIMWKPEALVANDRYIIELNPFYSFIELIRAPLLGMAPTVHNILFALIITFIGAIAGWKIFVSRRNRIVYWL